MKKGISVVLFLSILSSLSTNAFAAFTNEQQTGARPYTYQEVAAYISDAEFDIVLDIGGTEIHYFYGDGYTVYEEHGRYNLVYYGDDYSEVSINGQPLDVAVIYHKDGDPVRPGVMFRSSFSRASPYASSSWTYMFTDRISITIGGVAVSVAISLIPVAGLSAAAIKAVSKLIASKAVNNIVPDGKAITIRDDWYYANLDPWLGTVDYRHDFSVWYGTYSAPYQENVWGDYYHGPIVERLG